METKLRAKAVTVRADWEDHSIYVEKIWTGFYGHAERLIFNLLEKNPENELKVSNRYISGYHLKAVLTSHNWTNVSRYQIGSLNLNIILCIGRLIYLFDEVPKTLYIKVIKTKKKK